MGNGDGGQTAATIEAALSQTRDGVGNGDGGQTVAIIEAVFSQTRDGVGYGDGGQTAATPEAVISQTRNTKASLYSFVTYYSVGNNYYKLNIPYYIVKKILYYYYKGYIDFLAIFWWNRFV